MDKNAEIKQWLKSKDRDHKQGAIIYAKYGKNDNLKKRFLVKEDRFGKEKLPYELEKLLTEVVKNPRVKNKPVKVNAKVKAEVKAEPVINNEPVEITPEVQAIKDSLISQKTAVHNKKGMLANQLNEAQSDEQRKAIVDQMDEKDVELDGINEKLESIEKTGKLPEVKSTEKVLSDDRAKLQMELTNARSRISKNQKNLKALGNSPGGKKYQQKINADRKLIKEIEGKIK